MASPNSIFFKKNKLITLLDVANVWFHSSERFLAVTFGVFSNTLGTGIGYLASTLIVQKNYVREFIFFEFYI